MLENTDFMVRLGCALFFGGIMGLEREYYGKSAGVRTYALVALGSALYTLLSLYGFGSSSPDRVAANIVVGIGFLGAGLIIHNGTTHVRGLTTAAGLWVSSAIGMAFGVGWFSMGIVTSVLSLVILNIFGRVRYTMEHHYDHEHNDHHQEASKLSPATAGSRPRRDKSARTPKVKNG